MPARLGAEELALNTGKAVPPTGVIDDETLGTANAVTLTCRWGGATGNQIDLRHSYRQEDALPSGVSLALTAFSGGATDPGLSTALAALGDTQYHTLALPYSDSAAVSALSTVLKKRWEPTVAKEGVAFISGGHAQPNDYAGWGQPSALLGGGGQGGKNGLAACFGRGGGEPDAEADWRRKRKPRGRGVAGVVACVCPNPSCRWPPCYRWASEHWAGLKKHHLCRAQR